MKDTDKVTLTVAQLKKLVTEAKAKKQKVNEAIKEYDGRKYSYVKNYVRALERIEAALEANIESGYAFLDLMSDPDAGPDNKEWVRNFKDYNREYVRTSKKLEAEWNKLPVT